MKIVHFAYPGRLELKTGGYAYDRRLIEELRAMGWHVELIALGHGFPFPDPQTLSAAEHTLSRLEDGSLVLVDGLAFGVLDAWAGRENDRLTIAALVHHPLALETGLSHEQQAAFLTSERTALSAARTIVVTSPATARELTDRYGVPESTITVALPGTDRAQVTTEDRNPLHILSIGTLIPRKGHDVLIEALADIAGLDWTCTIIGSRDLDPATSKALAKHIGERRLENRVTLAGECEDTRSELAKADIFALASRYEGYGMVFAEALVQGLPIVACRAGAVPDVVPESAGFLVPPDDAHAFAAALRSLLTDADLRRNMGAAAAAAGAALPTWRDTARLVNDSLTRILK